MKIAMIAPLIERVPPKKYGGTERVIYHLTEELVSRGHDVTLFASGDSKTSATLKSIYPKPLNEAKEELKIENLFGANIYSVMHIGEAYAHHKEFDIIHDHTPNPLTGYLSLPAANAIDTPVVFTLHNALTIDDNKVLERLRKPYIVTISESQGMPTINLNYGGVVYNGLKMDQYPISDKHEDYLLLVGRICEEKGTHYAIEVAEKLNKKLIIAATLHPHDEAYFKARIEPHLSEDIKWIGEIDEHERNELMSKAMCLLHPVTWPEPFGLVLIEAMACGCPVLAFNQGAIPEVVWDGKTGFVVRTLEEMIDHVSDVSSIDRKKCREYALANFSSAKMADGYEEVYRKIFNKEI
jgi:glycosyltransferase involved in cell wall biosynthesis